MNQLISAAFGTCSNAESSLFWSSQFLLVESETSVFLMASHPNDVLSSRANFWSVYHPPAILRESVVLPTLIRGDRVHRHTPVCCPTLGERLSQNETNFLRPKISHKKLVSFLIVSELYLKELIRQYN